MFVNFKIGKRKKSVLNLSQSFLFLTYKCGKLKLLNVTIYSFKKDLNTQVKELTEKYEGLLQKRNSIPDKEINVA